MKQILAKLITNKTSSNTAAKTKQNSLLLIILIVCSAGVFAAINLLQSKKKIKVQDNPRLKVEVASEAIDPEKMWRNHFEEELFKSKERLDDRLRKSEEAFAEKERLLLDEVKRATINIQEQLDFAKRELVGATMELQRANDRQEEAIETNSPSYTPNITATKFETEIEFDKPKSSKLYVPETSFVTGYTLGGLAVSTALNTPDENATPVVIRLSDRGNLPQNFETDISTCRILGSAYGDLASERAVIRAEKLICINPTTQLIVTSNVAGTIHGPDGMNGVKGKVVATNSKFVKNAMIGGVISGLANSAKGQDGMAITNLGVSTKKKGFKQMAGEGAFSGASNAAEKVADYYLRMAEQMSPVLTVPGGVKVQVMFIKGFFIGELGTHKRIAMDRDSNKKFGEK